MAMPCCSYMYTVSELIFLRESLNLHYFHQNAIFMTVGVTVVKLW